MKIKLTESQLKRVLNEMRFDGKSTGLYSEEETIDEGRKKRRKTKVRRKKRKRTIRIRGKRYKNRTIKKRRSTKGKFNSMLLRKVKRTIGKKRHYNKNRSLRRR